MKTIIVLAMHGAPPGDFPRRELGEFFGLRGRIAQASGNERGALERRYEELEQKMREWPRSSANDPYWSASGELADALSQATGREVLLGFNEFCGPTLDQALDDAVARGAGQVTTITPMMTRGGEHSEVDIPAAVERARGRHSGVSFLYVWPFEVARVATFLASQIERYEMQKTMT